MKRRILYFSLILLSITMLGQDGYEKDGDRAFSKGDYTTAIQKYNGAKAFLESKNVSVGDQRVWDIEKKISQSKELQKIQANAQTHFDKGTELDYREAIRIVDKILEKNKKDQVSRNIKINAQNRIATIELNRKDEAAWRVVLEKVKDNARDKLIYENYLSEFQEPLYRMEAENALSKIADEELWDKVRATNTQEAYEKYLVETASGYFKEDAKKAINEIKKSIDERLWNVAKELNTKAAYEEYLATTEIGYFKNEADIQLSLIKDVETWRNTLKAGKKEDFQAYLTGDSKRKQYEKQASAYISAFEAMEYMEKGHSDAALTRFKVAKQTITLSKEQEKAYLIAAEDETFKNVVNSRDEEEIKEFMNNYPNSRHYNEVSSLYSELLANKFSELGLGMSNKHRKEAMSYAKSESSKNYVQRAYDKMDQQNAKIRKDMRWADRVNLGIGLSGAMFKHTFSLTPKLLVKFGRYSDVVNFSLGVEYNYIDWLVDKEGDDGKIDEGIVIGQLSIPADLRFNLFKVGEGTKIYLSAGGRFNLNISSKYKKGSNEMSDKNLVKSNNFTVVGQLGIGWRTGDFSIFYQHDITDLYNKDYALSISNNLKRQIDEKARIGLSYIWYIPLTTYP